MPSDARTLLLLLPLLIWTTAPAHAQQERGRIEGQVIMAETGDPLHAATVIILELDRSTETDDDGKYSFRNVPPGTYHLLAHVSSALTEVSERVDVTAGQTSQADFALHLAKMHESISVTASGNSCGRRKSVHRSSFQ